MAKTNRDGDNTRRRRAAGHLTRVVTAGTTRPWAVLWASIPVAWQLSAQSAGVNRMNDYFVTTRYVGTACA